MNKKQRRQFNEGQSVQLTLLDQVQPPRTCDKCGGTILAPTVRGVPRGSCHCAEKAAQAERFTDWSAETLTRVRRVKPQSCCQDVIDRYEANGLAETAKQRGNVALYCKTCTSGLVYDGKWYREVR